MTITSNTNLALHLYSLVHTRSYITHPHTPTCLTSPTHAQNHTKTSKTAPFCIPSLQCLLRVWVWWWAGWAEEDRLWRAWWGLTRRRMWSPSPASHMEVSLSLQYISTIHGNNSYTCCVNSIWFTSWKYANTQWYTTFAKLQLRVLDLQHQLI